MKDDTKSKERTFGKPKAKAAPARTAGAASEQQYRIFFEAASDGILVAEVDSKKFIHANPAICRMYGYTEEELLSRSVFNNHPADAVPYVISEFEAQARGEKLTAENIPCLRKDGSVFYADINTTSAIIDGVNCNIGFFRDVTARIATENALRKSEEINKTIVELTVDYVFIVEVTPAGALILKETTENLVAATGRTIDEARTIDAWRKIFHPQDLEKAMSFVNSVVTTGKSADLEARTFTKHGKQRWIQVYVRPVIDEKTNKVKEVIGAVKDISARKSAEQALKDSENKFYTAFETSPLLMAISTLDEGRFIDANTALLETLGYTKEEFIGKTSKEMGFIKDDAHRRAILKQIAETGALRHYEMPVVTKSGEIRHGSFFGAPLTFGSAKYLLTIMDDITERKHALEALRESNHRFKSLFDNSRDAIFIADPDSGIIIDANAEAENLINRPKSQLIGMHQSQLHPPGEETFYRARFKEAAGKDPKHELTREREIITSDGRIVPVEIKANTIELSGGKKIMQGIFTDITRRKRALEALRDANESLRATVEAAPLAVFVIDDGGVIQSWNPAAVRLFGWSEQEAIGGILPIVPPEKLGEFNSFLNFVLAGNTLNGVDAVRVKKDGTPINIRISAAPIYAPDGKVGSAIALVEDITERKRNEEELERYKLRLEDLVEERTAELKSAQDKLIEAERLAILGHFAGSVAHEIRNPLAVIDGNIHLLKKSLPKDDERSGKYIKTIRKHIKRSVNTIESLLDLTRSDVKKSQSIDIGMWLTGYCENVFMPDNIKISCVGAGKSARVFADVVQLDIAMKNIIKNAAEAMRDGGEITLGLDITENGTFAEIRVSDTGPGIPQDKLPLIFQPLYTTKFSGFGFGLSLTKIIIERHDGSIQAESHPGGGATFTIRLPITGA